MCGMSDYSTPLGKFMQQRRQAKQREVAWELTYEEWWAIWQESGKWEQRGRKAGCFAMCRKGDVGPYRAGNVFIGTHANNVRDANRGTQRLLGRGRGWTLRNAGARRYQVVVGGKYVGLFATQEEAEAAYAFEIDQRRVHSDANFCPIKPHNTTQQGCEP